MKKRKTFEIISKLPIKEQLELSDACEIAKSNCKICTAREKCPIKKL